MAYVAGEASVDRARIVVLLVEDDFYIGLEYCDILEQTGLVVAGPVASEQQARSLLESEAVNIALLDVAIENGDSFALADELRKRAIPFGFISAFAGSAEMFPDHLRDCPRLAKPAHRAQIESLISQLLTQAV